MNDTDTFLKNFRTNFYAYRMPKILRYEHAQAFLVEYHERYEQFQVWALELTDGEHPRARLLQFHGKDVAPLEYAHGATCHNGMWHICAKGYHNLFDPVWFVTREEAEKVAVAIEGEACDLESYVWQVYPLWK